MELDGFVYDQIVFRFGLFLQPGRHQRFGELQRASVHDRRFGTAHLDPAVVDLQAVEGRKDVFGGVHLVSFVLDGRSPADIDDMLDERGYFGTVLDIRAYEAVAVVFGSRLEGDHALLTGVQAGSPERNFLLKGSLMNQHFLTIVPDSMPRRK